MNLLHCHIENFGTLSNVDFDFSSGYNLFEKDNGWGKSTLAAFIKVMFYGFDGERQRQASENERKKYQPWQGGPYGGSITFQINNGKKYTAERVFASKSRDDTFSLRDADTNTPSPDFSENLGEEVFHVDKEAFKRTFYISQGNRFTKASDGINAKIGGLFEQSDDIGNYEDVERHLSDIINKDSPTRKTGRLYKLSENVAQLKERVRALLRAVSVIPVLLDEETELKDCIDKINIEREDIRQKQNRYIRMKELESIRVRHDDATDFRGKCQATYDTAKEELNGADATHNEIAERLASVDNLFAIEGQINAEDLSPEQSRLLDSPESKLSSLPIILGIIGILGIACGLVSLILSLIPSAFCIIIIMCIGAALMITAFILYLKNTSKLNLDRQYRELYSKQRIRFNNACREFDNLYGELLSFLNQQNVSPCCMPKTRSEAVSMLRRELDGMERRLSAFERAQIELNAAKEACEKFENDERYNKYLDFEMPNDLTDNDSLSARLLELQNEENSLRHRISELNNKLNFHRIEADDLEEAKEELALLSEEYDSGIKKYNMIKVTQEYLHAAKENFTAKYSSPVMKAFSLYCQAISGQDASIFHVDANSDITVDAEGMQRSSDFLSAGYRDLVGIALRMAFTDAMFPDEKPFIVMDDPLVNLDSTKADAAAAFIRKISENHQIIYFTCHSSRSI